MYKHLGFLHANRFDNILLDHFTAYLFAGMAEVGQVSYVLGHACFCFLGVFFFLIGFYHSTNI